MFKAYFTENRTISDKGVIAAIAGECGLDSTGFAAEYQVQELRLAAQVINGHERAIRLGINAVPTIIVNDRASIPGAQDTGTYIYVLDELLSELPHRP